MWWQMQVSEVSEAIYNEQAYLEMISTGQAGSKIEHIVFFWKKPSNGPL